MLAVQISAFIIVAGALGGILVFTDVYDDVQSRIVTVLCLSCIKLDPKTQLDFTFKTATSQHPDFVIENLTKGPVFLAFRDDVCQACDDMEPLIQEIFNVYFEKEETLYETVDFNGTNVTFVHISIELDHSNEEQRESRFIYDKDHIGGVPQFTIVTLGYDQGVIRPYYATAYGKLGLDNNKDRKALLIKIIQDGIFLYNENRAGYDVK